MTLSWNGKSKGTVLGYKIFVFTIKYTGLGAAYFILKFVSLYYLLFSWKTSSCLFYYFKNRLHFGTIKSVLSIYRNYYIFGQTLIDKIAVLSGFRSKFTYTFQGEEHIRHIIELNKGGLLISAHIGNWELAGHLLKGIVTKINIVVYEGEHAKIKQYLNDVMKEQNFNFIVVNNNGLDHIYQINEALEKKELICLHGDRFIPGTKTTSCEFLGEKALFPLGPFMLASQMQVPVSFVFSIKDSDNNYHFYASAPIVYQAKPSKQERDVETIKILHLYVESMQSVITRYPTQWFNYYHFWKTQNQTK